MKTVGDRRVRAVLVVLLSASLAVAVNVATGDFAWWAVALAALLVVLWAAVEWRNAVPDRRPYLPPPGSPPEAVRRPALIDHVARLVTASSGERRVVVLCGPPGFGKTFLARLVVADDRVRKHFPDRVFWVGLRQFQDGSDLADVLVTVAAQVTGGDREPITDPLQAGDHLGRVLGDRPALLVVDDAWTAGQLEPFHFGAPACVLLITTRVDTAVPGDADRIAVGELTADEARAVLGRALDPLPDRETRKVLGLAGGMALAVVLINRSLAARVRAGSTVTEAARALLREFPTRGIRLLDRGAVPTDRAASLGATIALSLGVLDPPDRDRFPELGIFVEGAEVPVRLAACLWREAAGMAKPEAAALIDRLANVGLIVLDHGAETFALHDVIRGYARAELGAEEFRGHAAMLAGAAAMLPPDPGGAGPAWWRLPADEEYLWRYLVVHLHEADPLGPAGELATDLRWVAGKLEHSGLAAVVTDLDLVGGDRAAGLRRVLETATDLLAPTDPPYAVRDILLSRVPGSAAEAEASRPRLFRVWPMPDLPDETLRRTFRALNGPVHALAVAPDGTWIATAGTYRDDRVVRLWSAGTGHLIRHLEAADGVWALAVSGDGDWLAVAGDGPVVTVWDCESWTVRTRLDAESLVTELCASATGDRLAGLCGSDGVRLWSVADGTLVDEVSYPAGVRAVALAPDGSWFATAVQSGSVIVREIGAGEATRLDPGAECVSLAVTRDGRTLVGTDRYDRLHRWSTDTWEHGIRAAFEGRTAIAPDGSWFAVAASDERDFVDHRVAVGLVGEGSELHILRGHLWDVTALAIAPDGRWLASGDYGGVVRIWDRPAPGHRARPRPEVGYATDAAFTADGRYLLVGHRRRIRRVEVTTERDEEWTDGPSRSVATAPEGGWACAAGVGGVVMRWDTETGTVAGRLDTPIKDVRTVRIGPDGTIVAAGGGAHISVWPAGATEPRSIVLPEPDGGDLRVDVLAFGWDGTAACADNYGYVHLVGLDGTYHHAYPCSPGRPLFAVVVALRGGWLAAAGMDGRIRVFRRAGTDPVQVLDRHASMVSGLALSPDERYLASCDNHGVIRVWETDGWSCETMLRTHGYLHQCSWSPDGRRLAVTSGLGVYLFEFRPAVAH